MTVMASPAEIKEHWRGTTYPPQITVKPVPWQHLSAEIHGAWLSGFERLDTHCSDHAVRSGIETLMKQPDATATPRDFLIAFGQARHGNEAWIRATARDLGVNESTFRRIVQGDFQLDWSHGIARDALAMARAEHAALGRALAMVPPA